MNIIEATGTITDTGVRSIVKAGDVVLHTLEAIDVIALMGLDAATAARTELNKSSDQMMKLQDIRDKAEIAAAKAKALSKS